jgi:hypothetical protein
MGVSSSHCELLLWHNCPHCWAQLGFDSPMIFKGRRPSTTVTQLWHRKGDADRNFPFRLAGQRVSINLAPLITMSFNSVGKVSLRHHFWGRNSRSSKKNLAILTNTKMFVAF